MSASKLKAWLQLIRVPNLFTVPGDPMAGFVLASTALPLDRVRLTLVAAVSVFFYCAGLILNDVFDAEEDRVARPGRPIPSGNVKKAHAVMVALVFTIGGLAGCFVLGTQSLWVGLSLVVAILLYNLAIKEVPVLGPLNMGLCRGLSVLLGASAVQPETAFSRPVTTAATIIMLYIAAITQVARSETEEHPPGLARWLPFVVLVFGGLAFAEQLHAPTPRILLFAGPFTLAVLTSLIAGLLLGFVTPGKKGAVTIPSLVGLLISTLIFMQAGFIAASGAGLCAIIVLLCWPVSRYLARRFYAS